MQDPSVRELMIIVKQDGTLEDDVIYGDGDKMTWSENTIREEVTDRDRCEEGVEGENKETIREERRRVQA